jgi:hypothetical protein
MARLTYWDARAICSTFGIDPRADFHTLPSAMVDAIIRAADARKYAAPKNANGSRARYFHAYLARTIAKGEDVQ